MPSGLETILRNPRRLAQFASTPGNYSAALDYASQGQPQSRVGRRPASRASQAKEDEPNTLETGEVIEQISLPDGSLVKPATESGRLVKAPGKSNLYLDPTTGEPYNADPSQPSGLRSAWQTATKKARDGKIYASISGVGERELGPDPKVAADEAKATAKREAENRRLALAREKRPYNIDRVTGEPVPLQTDEEWAAAKQAKAAKLDESARVKRLKDQADVIDLEADRISLTAPKPAKEDEEAFTAAESALSQFAAGQDMEEAAAKYASAPATDEASQQAKAAAENYLAYKDKVKPAKEAEKKVQELKLRALDIKEQIINPQKWKEGKTASLAALPDDDLVAEVKAQADIINDTEAEAVGTLDFITKGRNKIVEEINAFQEERRLQSEQGLNAEELEALNLQKARLEQSLADYDEHNGEAKAESDAALKAAADRRDVLAVAGTELEGRAAKQAQAKAGPENVHGYEIRKPYPGEDAFFKSRKEVAGMAAEDGKIVLNPYSSNTPEQQKAVARNEAARLWMEQENIDPQFSVTPEQAKAFEGTEYGKPENMLHLKRTLIARWITGDPSAPPPTEEQKVWTDKVAKSLPKDKQPIDAKAKAETMAKAKPLYEKWAKRLYSDDWRTEEETPRLAQEAAKAGLDVASAKEALQTYRQLDWSNTRRDAKTGQPIAEEVRTLPDGNVTVNPTMWGDAAAYKKAVEASQGTPEGKAKALKVFPKLQEIHAEKAVEILSQSANIPGADNFMAWRERKIEEDQATQGKLGFARQSPAKQAIAYMEEMKNRSWFRKAGEQVAMGLLAGFQDIATQALGVGGMVTGSETLADLAAANSENTQSVVGAQNLEGSDTDYALRVMGMGARMAPAVAAMIAGAGAVGGGLGTAAVLAGGQTAGSMFADLYRTAKEDAGLSHGEAWKKAALPAALAGVISGLITKGMGPTGLERIFSDKAMQETARNTFKGLLGQFVKGAAEELPEEIADEYFTTILQESAASADPVATLKQFAASLPELAGVTALMGGAGALMQARRQAGTEGPGMAPPLEGEAPAMPVQPRPAGPAPAPAPAAAAIPTEERPSISKTGLKKAAYERMAALREKRDGKFTLDKDGNSQQETIGAILTPTEEKTLKLLEDTIDSGDDVDVEALAEAFGYTLKETIVVDNKPAPPPPATAQDVAEQIAKFNPTGATPLPQSVTATAKRTGRPTAAVARQAASGAVKIAQGQSIDQLDIEEQEALGFVNKDGKIAPADNKVTPLVYDYKGKPVIRNAAAEWLTDEAQEGLAGMVNLTEAERKAQIDAEEAAAKAKPAAKKKAGQAPAAKAEVESRVSEASITPVSLTGAVGAEPTPATTPAPAAPADFNEYEAQQIEQANRDAALKALKSNSQTAAIIVDGNGVTLQMGDRQSHPTQNTALTATVTDGELTADERKEAKRISQEGSLAETQEERAENRANQRALVRRVFERVHAQPAAQPAPAQEAPPEPAPAASQPKHAISKGAVIFSDVYRSEGDVTLTGEPVWDADQKEWMYPAVTKGGRAFRVAERFVSKVVSTPTTAPAPAQTASQPAAEEPALTPAQADQMARAQADHEKRKATIQKMENDPEIRAKKLYAENMQFAAIKRQITGKLTGKEAAAKAKREASNYEGKPVSVDGKNATVIGTAFGKVKVKFEDGTTSSVAADKINAPVNTAAKEPSQPAPASQEAKPAATFKAGDFVRANGKGPVFKVESIGEDGWVYLANGQGSYSAEDAAKILVQSTEDAAKKEAVKGGWPWADKGEAQPPPAPSTPQRRMETALNEYEFSVRQTLVGTPTKATKDLAARKLDLAKRLRARLKAMTGAVEYDVYAKELREKSGELEVKPVGEKDSILFVNPEKLIDRLAGKHKTTEAAREALDAFILHEFIHKAAIANMDSAKIIGLYNLLTPAAKAASKALYLSDSGLTDFWHKSAAANEFAAAHEWFAQLIEARLRGKISNQAEIEASKDPAFRDKLMALLKDFVAQLRDIAKLVTDKTQAARIEAEADAVQAIVADMAAKAGLELGQQAKPPSQAAVAPEVAPEAASPQRDAVDDELAKAFDGLSAPPATQPIEQVALPKERREAMLKAAGNIVDLGLTEPTDLAARLDKLAPNGSLRKYARSFWRLMTGFNADLQESPDWQAVFDSINVATQSVEDAVADANVTPPQAAAIAKEEAMPEPAKQAAPFDPVAAKGQKKYLLTEVAAAVKAAPRRSEMPEDVRDALNEIDEITAKFANQERRPLTADESAELSSQVKKLSAKVREAVGTITIEVPGDGTFTILNEKGALALFQKRADKFPTTQSKDDMPAKPTAQTPTAVPSIKKPKTTADMVAAIYPMVSTDTTRDTLTTVKGDGTNLWASNGRILVRVEQENGGGKGADNVSYDEKGNAQPWPVEKGNYNGEAIIPDDRKVPVHTIDTGRWFSIMSQARAVIKVLPSDKSQSSYTKAVSIYQNPDGSLGAFTSDAERGDYVHNIQPNAKFLASYDPEYVQTILRVARNLGNEQIELRIADDISPATLRTSNATFVIMPMRVNGAEAYSPKSKFARPAPPVTAEASPAASEPKAVALRTQDDTPYKGKTPQELLEIAAPYEQNGPDYNRNIAEAAAKMRRALEMDAKFWQLNADELAVRLEKWASPAAQAPAEGTPIKSAQNAINDALNQDDAKAAIAVLDKLDKTSLEKVLAPYVPVGNAKTAKELRGRFVEAAERMTKTAVEKSAKQSALRSAANALKIALEKQQSHLSGHSGMPMGEASSSIPITDEQSHNPHGIGREVVASMWQAEVDAAKAKLAALQAPAEAPEAAQPAQAMAEGGQGAKPAKAEAGIADFGEKILGARKDLWGKFKRIIEQDLPDSMEDVTLAKNVPEPDYEAAIANGVPVEALAVLKAIRDVIPPKPKKMYKLKSWGEAVKFLHKLTQDTLASKSLDPSLLTALEKTSRISGLAGKIALYQRLGYPLFTKAKPWTIGNWDVGHFKGQKLDNYTPATVASKDDRSTDMLVLRTGKDAFNEVADMIKAQLKKEAESPSPDKPKTKEIPFNIYRDRFTNDHFIGRKGINGVVRLKAGFSDVKAARQYLADNKQALEEQWEGMKIKPDYRRTVNQPRQGPERRDGDVTPEMFQSTFGFRGVQFGNWVEGDRRQTDLNQAFDALIDLAEILGVPPKAMSLDGSLGLAFGARGTAGAKAHYEPGEVVINLTKETGPGSLAHEWFHAFDNYFARLDTTGETKARSLDKFATSNKKPAQDKMRPAVWEAFKRIRTVLDKGTFADRSKSLDDARSKPYYSTLVEKAARAFEQYTVDRLAGKEIANDYLVNLVKDESPALPTQAEMDNDGIRAAYDNLFNVLDAVDTDTGVRLQLPPADKGQPAGLGLPPASRGYLGTVADGDVIAVKVSNLEKASHANIREIASASHEDGAKDFRYNPQTQTVYWGRLSAVTEAERQKVADWLEADGSTVTGHKQTSGNTANYAEAHGVSAGASLALPPQSQASVGQAVNEAFVKKVQDSVQAGRPVGTSNPTTASKTGEGTDSAHNVELDRLRKNNPLAYRQNALILTRYPVVAKKYRALHSALAKADAPVIAAKEEVKKAKAALAAAQKGIKDRVALLRGMKTAQVRASLVNEFIAANLTARAVKAKDVAHANLAKANAKAAKAADYQSKAISEILDGNAIPEDVAAQIYEDYITAVESNLLTLIKLFPKRLRDVARLWYDGANIIAQKFGKQYNATLEQASGVLAVFSPQKDWFMNVSLAQRMMNIWANDQETVWNPEMTKQFIMRSGEPQPVESIKKGDTEPTISTRESLITDANPEGIVYQHGAIKKVDDDGNTYWENWDNQKAAKNLKAAQLILKDLEGKTLSQIKDRKLKARFIRILSEVRDSSAYPIVTPDGRMPGTMQVNNDKVTLSKVAWGGYNTIEKAISIMERSVTIKGRIITDEHEVISIALGDQHKVRSFYNNIVDPANKSGHVTMDTHAIAAIHWMPHSGSSLEVTQNFGGGGVKNDGIAGIKGTYAANAEAYRRAAVVFKLLPREVQSITWEAVRLLFPKEFKTKGNIDKVRAIWNRYLHGDIDIETARAEIFTLATTSKDFPQGKDIAGSIKDGKGLGDTAWAAAMGVGIDNSGGPEGTDDSGTVPKRGGPRGPNPRGSGGKSGVNGGGRNPAAMVRPTALLRRGRVGKPSLSLPPGQPAVTAGQDAEYLAAVEAGDLAKAQAMADEAAESGLPLIKDSTNYDFKTGESVVAHGFHGSKSQQPIKAFDRNLLGTNTSAESAKKGFFFAGSKDTASSKDYYLRRGFEASQEGEEWVSDYNKTLKSLIREAVEVTSIKEVNELPFGQYDIVSEWGGIDISNLLDGNVSDDVDYIVKSRFDFLRDELAPALQEMGVDATDAIQALASSLPKSYLDTSEGQMIDAYLTLKNPLVFDDQGNEYREQTYADRIDQALQKGYDSVIIKNTFDGGPKDTIIVVFEPSQIKSADPVTRDESGQVIPLSERFNPQSNSILRNPPAPEGGPASEAEEPGQTDADMEAFIAEQQAIAEEEEAARQALRNDPDAIDAVQASGAMSARNLSKQFEYPEARAVYQALTAARDMLGGPETVQLDKLHKWAKETFESDPAKFVEWAADMAEEKKLLDVDEQAVLGRAFQFLTREARLTGDKNTRALLNKVGNYYLNIGTRLSQALGARRDPMETPQERWTKALDIVFGPSTAVRRKLSVLPTELGKARRIASLEAQLAEVQGSRRADIEAALKTARAQETQEELLEKDDAESQKIKERVLKNIGVTEDDLMLSGTDRVAMHSAILDLPAVKAGLDAYKGKDNDGYNIMRLAFRGFSDAHIANALNLNQDDVGQFIRDATNAIIRPAVAEQVKAGTGFGGLIKAGFARLKKAVGLSNPPKAIEDQPSLAKGTRQTVDDVTTEVNRVMAYALQSAKARNSGKLMSKVVMTPGGQRVRVFVPFDPDDMANYYAFAREYTAAKASAFDKVYEYWINWPLLSGPQTQVANITGNAAQVAWHYTGQRFTEAFFNLFYQDPNAPQYREFKHILKGFWQGIGPAFEMARQTFLTEGDTIRHKYLGEPMQIDMVDGDLDKVGNIRASVGGKAGRISRLPGRVLRFTDAFFKTAIMYAEASAVAYRRAHVESKRQGLKGQARAAFIDTEIANTLNDTSSAVWGDVMKTAEELLFQDENAATAIVETLLGGGKSIKGIERLLADAEANGDAKAISTYSKMLKAVKGINSLLRLIFPFQRTPTNIVRAGIKKAGGSAISLLYGLTMAGWRKAKDGTDFVKSYPKAMQIKDASETLLAGLGWLALASMLEGDDDDDKKKVLLVGTRSHSLKERAATDQFLRKYGGENSLVRQDGNGKVLWSVPFGRYEPAATLLTTWIDAYRNYQEVKRLKSQGENASYSTYMLSSLVSSLEDKSFLQGFANAMQFIRDVEEKRENPDESAGVKMLMNNVIPNLIKQPLRNMDDVLRERTTAGPGYAALPNPNMAPKLPTFAAQPKISTTGESLPKAFTPPARLLFQANTKVTPQPDALLYRANRLHPTKRWSPQPLQRDDYNADPPGKAKPVPITDPAKKRQFAELAGRLYASNAAQVAARAMPSEKAQPGESLIKAFKKAREDAMAAARAQAHAMGLHKATATP